MGRWREAGLIGVTIVGVAIMALLWRCGASYYPVDRFAGLSAAPTDQGRAVLISGHVMGSFYCVGRLDSALNGRELNVRMRPKYICPQQRSGDFEVRIKVPQFSVLRVTYGEERSPILPANNRGR